MADAAPHAGKPGLLHDLKDIPTWVWFAGAGAMLMLFVIRRGGGGSTTVAGAPASAPVPAQDTTASALQALAAAESTNSSLLQQIFQQMQPTSPTSPIPAPPPPRRVFPGGPNGPPVASNAATFGVVSKGSDYYNTLSLASGQSFVQSHGGVWYQLSNGIGNFISGLGGGYSLSSQQTVNLGATYLGYTIPTRDQLGSAGQWPAPGGVHAGAMPASGGGLAHAVTVQTGPAHPTAIAARSN